MNLNAIKRRIEALEREAAYRDGGFNGADLLSPQDAAFLMVERQRLNAKDTPESAILAGRIDDLLKRHEKAARMSRQKPMAAEEAQGALERFGGRGDEAEQQYRREWLKRLEAIP